MAAIILILRASVAALLANLGNDLVGRASSRALHLDGRLYLRVHYHDFVGVVTADCKES